MNLPPRKVRIALAGVGNCASALIQGVHYYEEAQEHQTVPGLMHVVLGGYHVRDLEFVAAFDVDARKVGRDLSEAIFAPPNNTFRFCEVPPSGTIVQRGPTLDGIGRYVRDCVREAPGEAAMVAEVLRDSRAEVLVCYLPVGSEKAVRYYAEAALQAGCAMVNCVPVFIASDRSWSKRFQERGLPLVGDDIKSQVGATIVHRELVTLFRERGVRLDRTYQLNFGGNTDFLNMLERDRLAAKKLSKTNAVTSQLDTPLPPENVHIGPSDHVPWLADRKWCHIHLEGTGFGGVPLRCELKLEVWDSPNSAGVVIDAVRCAKMAMDLGVGGVLHGPSCYFMKSPPVQVTDHDARELVEDFVRAGAPGAPRPGPVAPSAAQST